MFFICLRGYYVIFLKSGVNSVYFSVKRKIYAGNPPRVQWVGLGWVGGDYGHRAAMTRSRNCSLAPIHPFTDCAFTAGGVIPEKSIPPQKRQKYLNRSHPYSIHTIFEFYSIHTIFKFYSIHTIFEFTLILKAPG